MQPLSILFGAGFTVAVGYSFGAVLLRKSSADPAIRFVAGSAILSALVFAASALHLLYPTVFLVLGAIAIVVARTEFPNFTFKTLQRRWLVFVPFAVLYLANGMAPEISFDGSRYHLGLVSRFVAAHGFYPIRESFYAAFPEGVEMLFAFAFAFGRHSAAALTHLAFLFALAAQVYTWVRREGGEVAGFAAAFLVFASPVLGVDAASAYIDVAVAAIAFTLFRVLELWDEQRSVVLLVTAGLLAGFAFAAKYTAFLGVPYAVGWVLWRSRRVRPGLVVAGVAAIVIAPWLVKNYLWFANPFAPFFNHYFPNPYVTELFEKEYTASQALPTGTNVPLQLTVWGSLGGLFGPLFLLTPAALVGPRRLLLAACVFGIGFVWNPGARFLIPALPFVASAMVLAVARQPRILWAAVGVHAVLSWPTVVRRYCRPDAWRLDKVTYREALRIKPEDGFVESNLPYYGAARMLDRLTPPGAVVYTQVPIPEAYTSRTVLVGYQSAANIVSRRVWFTGFVPEHAPVWRTRFRFSPRVATGLRLSENGAGWTVHEVRAFLGGKEVPRPGWLGPAEVIDGRPVSFWMSGAAGQSLELSFPQPLRVDEVLVESAMDSPNASFRLELKDGGWAVAGSAEFDQVAPPDNLRRQAADELRRRGIGYLLIFDGEFGADDLQRHHRDWGVTEVAEYKGARLYKLP